MQINFDIEIKDEMALIRHRLNVEKRADGFRAVTPIIFFVFLPFLGIVWLLSVIVSDNMVLLSFLTAVAIALFTLLGFAVYYSATTTTKWFVREKLSSYVYGSRAMTFTKEGIEEKSDEVFFSKWSEVWRIDETKDHFFVYAVVKTHIIPKRKISTDEVKRLENLFRIIEKKNYIKYITT